ncbi:MAG: hypothetical protein ACYDC8_13440 [Gammaproteobacteria bacterium]
MTAHASKRRGIRSTPRLLNWRTLRLALLALLLAVVALNSAMVRRLLPQSHRTQWVVVFPINADGSAVTTRYINALSAESFAPIEDYLAAQAQHYDITLPKPVTIRLGPELRNSPPETPFGGSVLRVVAWSLHLRWWAWRASAAYEGPPIDVRMFVRYHDPALSPRLDHSVGQKEGMIGIANVFADARMRGSNQVIIAHELLHTFGATDKYDPATNLPVYPDGYAQPELNPRYPQRLAELMAGRVPLSASRAEIPNGLGQTLIGPATAREIGWSR